MRLVGFLNIKEPSSLPTFADVDSLRRDQEQRILDTILIICMGLFAYYIETVGRENLSEVGEWRLKHGYKVKTKHAKGPQFCAYSFIFYTNDDIFSAALLSLVFTV